MRHVYVVILLLWAASCGPAVRVEDDGGGRADGPGPIADGPMSVVDGGNPYGDADVTTDGGCIDNACANPVADGCGAAELCGMNADGDGLDNDCDGQVDEGCGCVPGAVHACFLGPPGRRNVGACVDGTQTCTGSSELGSWGPCRGGISPTTEACDSQDNNCNGCADDDPSCCVVELRCPGPGDLPEAAPFVDYVIDGALFYGGAVTSWAWTVTGGPCDQLLAATSGSVSYQLAGATTSVLHFRPTLSGDYTITVTMTLPDGTVYTCTFVVHVRGPGLRVELCWDTTGSTDIDLHLHRPGSTTDFFDTGGGGATSPDDCYYANCSASDWLFPGAAQPDWGYPRSPLAECVGGPEGATWMTVGNCANPRLDIDNIRTVGKPENINVDNPRDGETFRVLVHFYSGAVTTHPMVNVYCGGTLLGTYGAAPDLVGGFDSGPYGHTGPMWRVVDATTLVDAAGTTTGCNLAALHPPGLMSGYWVVNDSHLYSPP